MEQPPYYGKEKSEPIQLSAWEENHTLLKSASESLALENSVAKVLLTEQARYPANSGRIWNSRCNSLRLNLNHFYIIIHHINIPGKQRPSILPSSPTHSWRGMREEKTLCAGASHLQENRMERNMQYLLVTLEIEGEV